MVIPREGDKIRIYVQLSDTDAVDPGTGRINLGRYGPERLLEVAKKTVRPYTIDAAPDKIEWWTIYKGNTPLCLRPRHPWRHTDHLCF
jgi:phenol 2-monooxygenase (NADPH)